MASEGPPPAAAGEGDAVSALSMTDARSSVRDDDNMSGYNGQREDGATKYEEYYNRLTKFYLKYNPDKLNRVDEFLKAYQGDEEQLFKLLSEKYGPEPAPPRRGSVCSTSDVGGPRTMVPRLVTREEGNTTDDTPYWPATKTVNDRDLCDVLETLQAANKDLAPFYKGLLENHPATSTNGMVYVSPTPVPSDGSKFLGHMWAGTLANNKVLVHKGVQYHRTVLHCTEQCSSLEWTHERWRLTMYRAEHTPNVLFRTFWDPQILIDTPAFNEPTTPRRGGFQVQYATRRRPASDSGSAGAPAPQVHGLPHGHQQPLAVRGHADPHHSEGSSSASAPPYQQPQQPMSLGPLELVLHHMQQLEQRLNVRLHSMEERLMNIETALLEPDQPEE